LTATITDANGNELKDQVSKVVVRDADGNVISETRSDTNPGRTDRHEEAAGAYRREVDRLHREAGRRGAQGAPNDNEIDRTANPCSPTSNFGCKPYRVKHMDKISSPVHGDDIKTMAGTGGHPNAGPSSAINTGIHDGSSRSGRGRRNGKPGSNAVDPEEIIPPTGGHYRK